MRVIVLTKPFGDVEPARLAALLAGVQADGADVVVREGQTVTPEDPVKLAALADEFDRAGLTLDVVSTDLIEPDLTADRVLAAAGAAVVRAGFFRYHPDHGYQQCFEQARRGLEGLSELAEKHGTILAIQLHHGTVHSSAALALRLVQDLDVRIYADPGNQAKEGSEHWQLTLDLIADRLACMGVKNASWHGHGLDWVPLADGVVPWRDILPALSFDGPLSLHVHYPTDDPAAAVRRDVAHLRGLL